MKRILYAGLLILTSCGGPVVSQEVVNQEQEGPKNLPWYFGIAYKENPTVPRGILEAVAFANTSLQFISHDSGDAVSCTGIPPVYGIMGLMEDGKNVFRNNLVMISEYSGYKVEDIKRDTLTNIRAYARAYAYLQKESFRFVRPDNIEAQGPILAALSELYGNDTAENYPLDYQLYSVYHFVNDTGYQRLYKFPGYRINFDSIFGEKKLQMLRSPLIGVEEGRAAGKKQEHVAGMGPVDYGPAAWVPAASCNFSKGRTKKITAIAIHDMEGSYEDGISWFRACPCSLEQCGHCPPGTRICENNKPVGPTSAHYMISNLGQVTQMVREADKAFHVGSENGYTIGIEHEGKCKTPTFTPAMYRASADLVKDICLRNHIDKSTVFQGVGCMCNLKGQCEKDAKFKIKGHQMYPSQEHTDPGPGWDWALYSRLINE